MHAHTPYMAHAPPHTHIHIHTVVRVQYVHSLIILWYFFCGMNLYLALSPMSERVLLHLCVYVCGQHICAIDRLLVLQ